jgi:hypothetical protein
VGTPNQPRLGALPRTTSTRPGPQVGNTTGPGRRLHLRTAGRWIAACRDALTPGGFLITAVDPTGAHGDFADHATTVIVAARACGLAYHQHLVTVTRPLPETDGPPPPLLSGARRPRVHADLYVFRKAGGRHA